MYPPHVILTLLGMITAGAGRIVAVKIFFQIELEESGTVTPLFVTLLYLVGQTLSLFVHCICTRLKCIGSQKDEVDIDYNTIEMAARIFYENENIPSHPETVDDQERVDRPAEDELMNDDDCKINIGE